MCSFWGCSGVKWLKFNKKQRKPRGKAKRSVLNVKKLSKRMEELKTTLIDQLEEESTLKNAAYRKILAEAAGITRAELHRLHEKGKRDQLVSDEVRVIPSLVSNLHRLVKSLGGLEIVDDEIEDLRNL